MRTIKRKNKEINLCLCGKPAVGVAYLPIGNVWSGLKEVCEAHNVCEYHAEKARGKGYTVEGI